MDKLSNHSTLLLVFLTPICATFVTLSQIKERIPVWVSSLFRFAMGLEDIKSNADERCPLRLDGGEP